MTPDSMSPLVAGSRAMPMPMPVSSEPGTRNPYSRRTTKTASSARPMKRVTKRPMSGSTWPTRKNRPSPAMTSPATSPPGSLRGDRLGEGGGDRRVGCWRHVRRRHVAAAVLAAAGACGPRGCPDTGGCGPGCRTRLRTRLRARPRRLWPWRRAAVTQRSARVHHVAHAGTRARTLLGCGTMTALVGTRNEEGCTRCPIIAAARACWPWVSPASHCSPARSPRWPRTNPWLPPSPWHRRRVHGTGRRAPGARARQRGLPGGRSRRGPQEPRPLHGQHGQPGLPALVGRRGPGGLRLGRLRWLSAIR